MGDSSNIVLELKSRNSAPRPTSQKIKVQLEQEWPEDLAVKEGDRVLAGEVLADQSSTRRGLELQKQQLLINIDQLAVPLAAFGELPPPDFGVEEAAIVAAKRPMAPTLQKLGHKARKLSWRDFQPSNSRILEKETTKLVHAF